MNARLRTLSGQNGRPTKETRGDLWRVTKALDGSGERESFYSSLLFGAQQPQEIEKKQSVRSPGTASALDDKAITQVDICRLQLLKVEGRSLATSLSCSWWLEALEAKLSLQRFEVSPAAHCKEFGLAAP